MHCHYKRRLIGYIVDEVQNFASEWNWTYNYGKTNGSLWENAKE
jgi:hypothetical protein